MTYIRQLYIEIKDESHECHLFHLIYDNDFGVYVPPNQDKLPATLEEIECLLEQK